MNKINMELIITHELSTFFFNDFFYFMKFKIIIDVENLVSSYFFYLLSEFEN